MPVAKSCLLPDPTTERLEDIGLDPNAKTVIEQRIDTLAKLLNSTQAGLDQKQAVAATQARAVVLDNMRQAGELSRATAINPNVGRSLQHKMARDLAVSKQALGLGDAYTTSGWVRESFMNAQRLWRGGLNKALRELAVARRMADAQKTLTQLLKQHSIPRQAREYIMMQSQELGWVNDLIDQGGINAVGRNILTQKVLSFVEELGTKYNLPPEVVEQVMQIGTIPSGIYRQVGEVMRTAGMEVGDEDLLLYFNRGLSEEAKARINWRWDDEHQGSFTWDNGQRGDIGNVLARSRLTHEFAAEDEVLLDYAFRNYGTKHHGSSTWLYDQVRDGAGIGDILDERRVLNQTFLRVLGQEPELIDTLVDMGVMSKIPITSAEFFEAMQRSYKMPFNRLDQVFHHDWNAGWMMYERQLERMAQESGIVHKLMAEALNGNWGIPQATVLADPATYKGFVPLVGGNTSVIPESLLPPGGADNPLIRTTYVHPVVADMARASLELQNSPVALGAFGRIMMEVNRRFRSLALTTIEYLPRQVWNSLISLTAGGGNLLRYGQYFTTRMLSIVGNRPVSEFLDNTKAVFNTGNGMLTERELWNYLEDIGYINRWEPMTGDPTRGAAFSPWNPISVAATLQDEGMMRTLNIAGIQIGSALDRAAYPMRLLNQVADDAGRFGAIVSSMRRDTKGFYLDQLGRVPTGGYRTFGTAEEAVAHWRNYFFYYDDQSKLDRALSAFVVPFWGFHSKNLPAAVRHAVRHPSRYVAFQRVYALTNAPVADDDRLNESTIPSWMMETNPIFFQLPNGQFFAIPTNSLDPLAAAYGTVELAGDEALRALGIWEKVQTQATGDRLDSLPWNTSRSNRAVDAAIETTYSSWRALASTIRGVDTFNRPLYGSGTTDTFLGYEMPRITRVWLEALLPILGTINRYNPWGVFGEAPNRDPFTGETTIGRGSRMPFSNAVPRSDSDSWSRNNPFATTGMQAAGLRIYPVDWALNAGYTYDDLRRNVRDGQRFVQKLEGDLLRHEPGSANRRQVEERIRQATILVETTRTDLNRLEDWARTHDLNVLDAAGYLAEHNIKIGDLPDASQQLNPQRVSGTGRNERDSGN